MKSILASVIALSLAASTAFAQLIKFNPSATAIECEPLSISWSGGQAPYSLTIKDSSTGEPLENIPNISGTNISWTVNLNDSYLTIVGNYVSAKQIVLLIEDSNGAQTFSASFNVYNGSAGSNCDTSTPSSFTILPSDSAATGFPTPCSDKTSASFSTASATSSTNASAGASRATGQIAAAGIIGAAMVALLG